MPSCETRNITVKAERDPTSFNGFEFQMFENGAAVKNDTIHSNKDGKGKKEDYHTIIFTLKNEGTSDLKFVGDPLDVMWVKPGNEKHAGDCPKKRSGDPDFSVDEVSADRLVVHNANRRMCKHKFVLNFETTKPDGTQAIVAYDPIWANGNGGSR